MGSLKGKLMNRPQKESCPDAELDGFRQKLELLESKLSESVDTLLGNQQKNNQRLARYLDKLPIEESNRKYILTHFEKEQAKTNQNNILIQELNQTLEEMLDILGKEKFD